MIKRMRKLSVHLEMIFKWLGNFYFHWWGGERKKLKKKKKIKICKLAIKEILINWISIWPLSHLYNLISCPFTSFHAFKEKVQKEFDFPINWDVKIDTWFMFHHCIAQGEWILWLIVHVWRKKGCQVISLKLIFFTQLSLIFDKNWY